MWYIIVNSEFPTLLSGCSASKKVLWSALEFNVYVWVLTWPHPSCGNLSIWILLSHLQLFHYIQVCEVNWDSGKAYSTGGNSEYVRYFQILSSPFFSQSLWRLHQRIPLRLTFAWIWLRGGTWWEGGEQSQSMYVYPCTPCMICVPLTKFISTTRGLLSIACLLISGHCCLPISLRWIICH